MPRGRPAPFIHDEAMSADTGRLMKAATVASTSVALVMIGAKVVAWLATDAVSMLSSLIDSSLDLVGSLITFIAVRTALSPADTEHRFFGGSFGHRLIRHLARSRRSCTTGSGRVQR